MHRHAELGVAAHWRYKEGKGARDEAYDDKIAWLRQMLAWRDEVVGSAEWVEQSKRAALDDTVYVLTPQGRVIDLPRGATPIDFAYALHTDLGHRCRGAKVDGVMVPLDYRLDERPAGRDRRGEGGRAVARLAHPSRATSRARARGTRSGSGSTPRSSRAPSPRAARSSSARSRARARRASSSRRLRRSSASRKADEFFAAVGREEIGPRALQVAVRGPEPRRRCRKRRSSPRRARRPPGRAASSSSASTG